LLPNEPGQADLVKRNHQDKNLKNTRRDDLSDRRTAAADAKAVLLNAHRSAMAAAEPTRVARQAERVAIASAREERRIGRERVKLEEAKRLATEAADREAAAHAAVQAEQDARLAKDNALIARMVEDEATRKAERDKRYANRKARQA
jgi:hypothetical protein